MVKPITPSPILSRKSTSPTLTGGDDRESMDRQPSDSNKRGVEEAPQTTEGNPPDGRGPSPIGVGIPQTPSPEGDSGVRVPQASNNPFLKSDNILQTIADRFVEARKNQKAPAWRQLQVDLMYASPYICPVIIPYKDLISIVADIEKEIKGATEQVGKSNEEIMANYLSGEGSLVVVQMDLAPVLDKSGILEADGGETINPADTPLSRNDSSSTTSPPSS